jgi:hypothetical protein
LKRLQTVVAQIQQSIPGFKRDGSMVLWAFMAELLHDESSTTRTFGVHIQSDFIRSLSEKINKAPEEVIKDFESLRRYSEHLEHISGDSFYSSAFPVTDPTGVRFSVTGNVLGVPNPRSIWNKHFSTVLPVSYADNNWRNSLLTLFGY